eukprot:2542316-Pyramimonas_sp.AAC.1
MQQRHKSPYGVRKQTAPVSNNTSSAGTSGRAQASKPRRPGSTVEKSSSNNGIYMHEPPRQENFRHGLLMPQ